MDHRRWLPFLVATLLLPGIFLRAAVGAEAGQFVDVKIERQPLGAALQELATQSGIQIIFFSRATEGYDAPPLQGHLTIDVALKRLLAGSKLTYRRLNATTIEILPINVLHRVTAIHPVPSPVNGAAPAAVPTFHGAVTQSTAYATSTDPNTATDASGTVSASNVATGGGLDEGLGEVIVTAQRRAENLQDVPIAVTAVSNAQLQATGVQNTMDLKGIVPGLNIGRAVGLWVQPFVRGIGTTAEGAGVENPVATYIDGVYMYNASAILVQLHDIDQVAVLKGPQGTLFGRNATGGLIQYKTLAPSQTPQLEADVTYGNLGTYQGNIYATGGLTSTLAGSLTASYDDMSRGFGHNLYNGDWVFNHDDRAFRAKLLWEPDEATQITFSADYTRDDAAQPVNRFVSRSVLDQPPPANPYNINLDVQPAADLSAGGYSLTVRHDLGFATFNSISSYRRDSNYSQFDADGTILAIQELHGPSWDWYGTQELQLLSPTTGHLIWVLGAFAMRADSWGQSDNLGWYFGPGPGTNAWSGGNGDQYLTSLAVYSQGTYKITANTDFIGGLRWTWDHRTAWGANYDGTWEGPVGVPISYEYPQPLNFNDPTYRASLDHHFSAEVMGYVSYNFGFRSGQYGNLGKAATATTPAVPATPVNPETLQAYEIGIKSDLLDHHLRINSAIYYYLDHNRSSHQIIDGTSALLDSAEATMYGIDTDAIWQLNGQFAITAGFSLEHAYYNSFGSAACVGNVYKFGCGTLVVPYNPPALPQNNYEITYGNDTGKYVEWTPAATVNFGPSYTAATRLGNVRTSINYYFNGGWYAAADNSVRQPAYSTLGADILWTISDRYMIRLWGQNLTNTFYADALTETALGPNEQVAYGRTYAVSLILRL